MPRPVIRTAPVTVTDKQIPVDPTAYPLPAALTPSPVFPPPPIPQAAQTAPYATIEDQQAPVEPIHSALANALIGLAMKQYQSPQPQTLPAPPQQNFGEAPPVSQPVTPNPTGTLQGILSGTGKGPVRDFVPPAEAPSQPAPQLQFDEPPATHAYTPSQQILAHIGVPETRHKAMEPVVAKTFPKAITPVQPSTQSGAPPKAFRATAGTVADKLDKFSPLRQDPAPTGRKVVVSLPDKKVVVYDKDGSILREYSVYIGRSSTPTPKGQFRIMENIKPAESEWYYGGHWLGFAHSYDKPGSPSYAGFHGWVYDKQDDVIERTDPGWKTSTGGCVQLGNKDVADLASLVGAGDPVSILDTPFTPPPPKPPIPQMRQSGFLQSLMPR